jgi:CheY-like chemotaxis protein
MMGEIEDRTPEAGRRRDAKTRADPAIAPRARTILLAEDHDDLRALLADALRAEGFGVIECPNGLELVERLVAGLESGAPGFDLVVSDVRMPGVTGLSVLEGLSDWDEIRDLPMVLITAFGDARLHALARHFGAVSLLEKPFEMAALIHVVRRAIEQGGAGAARA